jgi:hypothetical protein
MKHVKRIRTISFFLIIVIAVSTCGCFPSYSKDKVVMATLVFYAVPGAKTYEHQAVRCEIIDEDEYGRKLFACGVNDWPGTYVICILQKSEDNHVYYYDNISYQITEKFNQYTQEQMDSLKVTNDWNKAMKEDKMIQRDLVERVGLLPEKKSTINNELPFKVFHNIIEDEENITTFVQYFDYSQTGQELFFVSRYDAKTINSGSKWVSIDFHLMILNADGTYDPENYLLKIDDLSQSNAPLAEIKERNGWVG